MSVHWRERDWDRLREAVREQPVVRRHLAACGLLKFFDCPLIWSQEFLLQFLIQMWSTDLQCFVVWGEQLMFSTAEDIYFLTGLPFWGRALAMDPHLPGEDRVETIGTTLFWAEPYVGFGSAD
jgi:hypothetical protein